eukprot:2608273-Rhodomonas_salina.2
MRWRVTCSGGGASVGAARGQTCACHCLPALSEPLWTVKFLERFVPLVLDSPAHAGPGDREPPAKQHACTTPSAQSQACRTLRSAATAPWKPAAAACKLSQYVFSPSGAAPVHSFPSTSSGLAGLCTVSATPTQATVAKAASVPIKAHLLFTAPRTGAARSNPPPDIPSSSFDPSAEQQQSGHFNTASSR